MPFGVQCFPDSNFEVEIYAYDPVSNAFRRSVLPGPQPASGEIALLQPEQIEIAFRAVQELERRSQAVDQQWRLRLERLDYQAQLAQRRDEEVDPSNRLVAGTLEQRWNEALQAKATAQEELQEHRKQQGLELTEEQKGQLLALAKDLPQLWKSSSTTAVDRKRILRLLIKDITVERQQPNRKVLLHICWQGGAIGQGEFKNANRSL